MIPETVAPLVPLFAPYCGGLGRLMALESVLAVLLEGDWAGKRLLQGGRSHMLRLSWSGETAPQEILHCDLTFPDLPEVKYSFDLPCHQLVQWLMDREGVSSCRRVSGSGCCWVSSPLLPKQWAAPPKFRFKTHPPARLTDGPHLADRLLRILQW